MKKITCFVLALMLCVAGTAFAAESVPSKTTTDLTKIEITVENAPENAPDVFILPVNATTMTEEQMTEEYKETMEISQAEVKKLMEVVNAEGGKVEDYFSIVVDSEGNPVDLKAFLAAAIAAEGEEPVIDENMALDVFEFGPIVAGNYVEEYGNVTANMLFSTPYEKDQKVAVLIGIAKVNDEKKSQLAEGEELNSDCIDDIEWVAFEGVGQDAVEDQEETYGCVKVELTPEIVLAIQQAAEDAGTTALMAVVSQAAETEAAE